MANSSGESITTTVQTNKRGDVRIPAEVRKALGFDGREAILQVEIELRKIVDEEENNS
jgi:bifunctional DNA-binding transcriptional regulator/antitoxin component of YhaV-PrlF toxin-antitoxin module